LDLKSKIDLIKRNTVEIITENELKELLESKQNPITYCGYEPSGPLHLGHFVTITKLRDLEDAGFKVKILLADLHAKLNLKGDDSYINEQVKTWKKTVRILGLKNPEIVIGSDYQLEAEYWNDIMRLATNTTLNRGLRSMQEVARDLENAKISQLMYPLMQANDIKYLEVDVAQSGIEQRKIHMLAREQLPDIGWKAPVCVHTPLLNSLSGPGTKMSSSVEGSNISVVESEQVIKSRMKKAYCPQGETENNPVLEIAKLIVFPRLSGDGLKIIRKPKFGGDIIFKTYNELELSFKDGNIHPLDMKFAIASELNKIIDPIRKEFEKIS
jgi:tyrosyl-tRNA synthetase